ncbi:MULTISPECIES: hypothetical protein [Streptomyces]|uniref:Uncharacterized protein n=1 Tax=Streptomyces griseoaurantiacus TaxID=68213 RepID=A0A7W2DUI2_9ACTN|nr:MULTISPECIES: hypothetical protein [Streptomyces]MBA5223245.1 hypothetical protein [Streptomyces griseoaurantiacus]MDX3092917.1 hypothetical protein [Streptomyces sp. ME12-02E]MDX3334151.1 hypothetical protein [Streptomyces sp. ME02-6978a]WTI29133.1 hypothetical protein OHA67_23805 [Streptomyces jietaisiensis]GHE46185.1 hypothetical protein GCM10018782_20840 [Streptomyces griseoaurantiacus]
MPPSRVWKNLAIGLVITVVMTTLSTVLAEDGGRAEEFWESLAVGLSVTAAVTGVTWWLRRGRTAR